MSNPPYFPFYPADFLADAQVMLMTNQEVGCYLKLLCYCWREGSIPCNNSAIAKLCQESEIVMAELWQNIQVKFIPAENDPLRLINKKLNDLRQKQIERKLERSASGKKGMDSRWSKNTAVNSSVITDDITKNDSPVIATENENENNKPLKNKIKVSLPTNYHLSPEHIAYALEKKIPEQMIGTLFEDFCIYHRKTGSRFVDWYAAWQTWVRNDLKYYPEKYKAAQKPAGNQPRYLTDEDIS